VVGTGDSSRRRGLLEVAKRSWRVQRKAQGWVWGWRWPVQMKGGVWKHLMLAWRPELQELHVLKREWMGWLDFVLIAVAAGAAIAWALAA